MYTTIGQILFAKLFAATPLGNADDLGLPTTSADEGTLKKIFSAIFLLVGFMAVVYIIIGGYQYVTSTGNPDRAKKAWLTILYAIIGLIIAVSAFVLTNFVISKTPR